MARFPIPVLLAFMFAALLPMGCGRDASVEGPVREAIAGGESWTGTWPCADCAGIETRLELRDDGRYRLVETYLGTGAEDRFAREGDWVPATLPDGTRDDAIRLDPDGLDLWFARLGDGRLERRGAGGQVIADPERYSLQPD